jgi:hypothetical protein
MANGSARGLHGDDTKLQAIMRTAVQDGAPAAYGRRSSRIDGRDERRGRPRRDPRLRLMERAPAVCPGGSGSDEDGGMSEGRNVLRAVDEVKGPKGGRWQPST